MSKVTLGSYKIAYWQIKINSSADFSHIKALSPQDTGVFFHEYTHFIQEITTLAGLNLTWNILDRLRQTIASIQKTDTQIQIPVKNEAVSQELLYYNSLSAVIGAYHVRDDDGTLRIVAVTLPSNKLATELTGQQIPEVHLKLKNTDDYEFEYIFGVDAVQEAMTQLMEEKFYADNSSEHFPYVAAKRLAQFVCPKIAENPEHLFAACDVALLSPYPGWHFYKILLQLETSGFQINKTEEIYQFAMQFYNEEGWNVFERYEKAKNGTIHVIGTIIKDMEPFEEAFNWISYILEKAFRLKVDYPYLLLDLFREKPFGHSWEVMAASFGMPETTNSEHKRWFTPPMELRAKEAQIEPFILRALSQLNDFLLKGRISCQLKDLCLASRNNIVDDACDNEPWTKGGLEKTCAFGYLWNRYGFYSRDLSINGIPYQNKLQVSHFALQTTGMIH